MLKKSQLILLLLPLFAACNYFGGADSQLIPIAKVFDQYLYKEDLVAVIPAGSSKEDSAAFAKNYIDNWIRQQVIIAQAEANLSAEQKNFDLQVANYRNSLLVYTYEKNLIDQKLDTAVDEQTVEEYYKENIAGFKLNDPIVKAFYIKMDSTQHDAAKLNKLLRSEKASELEELRSYCQNHAVDYSFDNAAWVYLAELGQKMPITSAIKQEMLNRKGLHTSSGNGFVYYLYLTDFKPAGEIAPMSLLREEIKQRIIYQRKSKLIEQMRTDLLNDALNNKNVETFSENE